MTAKSILVLQSGFVFVGVIKEWNASVVLTEAACIRKWGTTDGLGQLALRGPTKETVLDACGTLTVPKTSVIFAMACPGWT